MLWLLNRSFAPAKTSTCITCKGAGGSGTPCAAGGSKAVVTASASPLSTSISTLETDQIVSDSHAPSTLLHNQSQVASSGSDSHATTLLQRSQDEDSMSAPSSRQKSATAGKSAPSKGKPTSKSSTDSKLSEVKAKYRAMLKQQLEGVKDFNPAQVALPALDEAASTAGCALGFRAEPLPPAPAPLDIITGLASATNKERSMRRSTGDGQAKGSKSAGMPEDASKKDRIHAPGMQASTSGRGQPSIQQRGPSTTSNCNSTSPQATASTQQANAQYISVLQYEAKMQKSSLLSAVADAFAAAGSALNTLAVPWLGQQAKQQQQEGKMQQRQWQQQQLRPAAYVEAKYLGMVDSDNVAAQDINLIMDPIVIRTAPCQDQAASASSTASSLPSIPLSPSPPVPAFSPPATAMQRMHPRLRALPASTNPAGLLAARSLRSGSSRQAEEDGLQQELQEQRQQPRYIPTQRDLMRRRYAKHMRLKKETAQPEAGALDGSSEGSSRVAGVAARRFQLQGSIAQLRPGYNDRLKQLLFKAKTRYNVNRQQQQSAAGALLNEMEEENGQQQHGPYNPQIEVVNDIVLHLLGFRLPEKACYGQRAMRLAALPVAEVKAQCRLWLEQVGLAYTARFLGKEPTLLAEDPKMLLVNLELFSSLLGLEDSQACVDFALRNTALLGLGSERLQEAITELAEVLGVHPNAARRLAVRNTGLLTAEPGALREKFLALSTMLPVGRDKLSAVIQRRPALLTRSVLSTAQSMASIAGITGMPLFDVALMVVGAPGIVGVSSVRLANRFNRLCAVAARHQPWQQQLEAFAPAALGRCLMAPEHNYDRLDYILAHQLQHDSAALKMKRILTASQASFEYTFVRRVPAVHSRPARPALAAAVASSEGPTGLAVHSMAGCHTNGSDVALNDMHGLAVTAAVPVQ